jgi:hypothetical protein
MDFLTADIRYILILICIVVTIWSIIRCLHKLYFTICSLFLAILGDLINQIPLGHFETVGGLVSIYRANPQQVLNDARVLADEYPTMTCFGDPEGPPRHNPIPSDKIPRSMHHLFVQHVLILANYVLIEKSGVEGVFRGFVVFRKGSDLWKNEGSITRG